MGGSKPEPANRKSAPHRRPKGGPSAAASRFREQLLQRILDGSYRPGQELPKLETICRDEGISKSTVAQALAQMASEELVTKAGRRWIIGTPSMWTRNSGHRKSRPVVCILQARSGSWASLNNPRTRRFIDAFSASVADAQVNLITMTFGRSASESLTRLASMPDSGGWDARLDRLQGLGTSLRGVLLVGTPTEFPDFRKLTLLLTSLKTRLALIDRRDQTLAPALQRLVHVCRFSEEPLAGAAVAHLVGHGHRHAAYAGTEGPGKTESWQRTRLALLREHGLRAAPRLKFSDYPEAMGRLQAMEPPALADHLERMHREGPSYARKTLTYLLGGLGWGGGLPNEAAYLGLAQLLEVFDTRPHCAANPPPWTRQDLSPLLPSKADIRTLWNIELMLPFLLEGSATALVAPRDAMMLPMARKLEEIGIRFPEDLSLLSFDNEFDPVSLPIDTVDIGADHLGYAAAHFLLGDLPIRVEKSDGSLLAVPRVIARGSVDPL